MTATLLSFEEALERFDPALGLEVHVELNTASKMFCGCATGFGAEPNTQVCPTCLGLPGAMPVVNGKAVESAIRIGLALNCEIAEWCRFARKNYFYPDMPKNFQTSQYDEPIAFEGFTEVEVDGTTYRIGIERAHMEEDTGKSLHVGGSTGRIHGADYSLVDYNRAGIPLIEIVTKPITGTGAAAPLVAKAYVAQLRDLLLALGVSDVRMEQGSLRCDVNLSLAPKGSDVLGTRTETKNVNSLRSVERAVRYEMQRHAAVLTGGESILQETRHWHEDTGVTTSGREKSDAEDYRYFPEPDLVPVAPTREWVEELRAGLPEAPEKRRAQAAGRVGLLRPRDARHRGRRRPRAGRGDHRRRRLAAGGPQVVARRPRPSRQRLGRRPRLARRHAGPGRRGAVAGRCRARSTTSSPARSSRVCWPGRAPPRRSWPPAGSRSSPTRARCRRPSTARSPPTPTWPTRSATASRPLPALSSVR